MRVDEFDFDLPESCIALRPVSPRDAARLLEVRGRSLSDHAIRDLPGLLQAGDTLAARKPDAAPLLHAVSTLGAERCIYVGDSEIDAETAQAAGMPFAFFTEGIRTVAIVDIPHDAAFSDFADLPSIYARLSEAQEG